ncbi:hypothetical protein R50073_25140 [Maricurvus nonylphenolicus]|uniref:hypothetical protein n=1 Tax=Maricurvus nonylphenolicus TaxID=1008307 RepID=UPI0036F3CA06
MNETWNAISRIENRTKNEGTAFSQRIEDIEERAKKLLNSRGEGELIQLSEITNSLDSIFKEHNQEKPEHKLTPTDTYKLIVAAELPNAYANLNPQPHEILCILSLSLVGTAIGFMELCSAVKSCYSKESSLQELFKHSKGKTTPETEKLIGSMDNFQTELTDSAFSMSEGAFELMFIASDLLVIAEQISGNPLSKYTPDEHAKIVTSIKATIAVNARHSRVKGTKDNFIKFYESEKLKNKETTKTSAAIKYYNSLSPEEQSKLAPSRIEANGTRTLLTALRKHEKSLKEDS